MDKLKLKWRIFAFLLGFCALLLVLLWLFQTVFLFDTYKLIRTREIESAVVYVQQNIDSTDLSTIIEELARDGAIMVTATKEFIPPQAPPSELKGRRMQETITREQVFTLKDGRTMSLTFHAIITPVDATVNTLKMQLYVITGVMLTMSILLSVLIAKRVSRPIEQINKGAKALAQGDYEVHFEGKGFQEVEELSDTLNTASRELAKVEGLRRELMANVSHDLRTPLSLIYSYAELMHDFPGEITPEQTQMIMDETQRLSSLVNDMLDIAQIESGIHALNKARFNLTEAVGKITARTAALIEKEGYTVRFVQDGAQFVVADEMKLMQAYYNLLINAVQYCGADKWVEVRQSVHENVVRIEVSDHGAGIAASDIPYVWDRYYKAGTAHKRAVTGSGLGLSIVRKIFELHGMEYGVESEIGGGSTFWFEADRQ